MKDVGLQSLKVVDGRVLFAKSQLQNREHLASSQEMIELQTKDVFHGRNVSMNFKLQLVTSEAVMIPLIVFKNWLCGENICWNSSLEKVINRILKKI